MREYGFEYLLQAVAQEDQTAISLLPDAVFEMAELYEKEGDLVACVSMYRFAVDLDEPRAREAVAHLWKNYEAPMWALTTIQATSGFSELKEKATRGKLTCEQYILLSLGYLYTDKNMEAAIDAAVSAVTSIAPVTDPPHEMPQPKPQKAEKAIALYQKAKELICAGGSAWDISDLLYKSLRLGYLPSDEEYSFFMPYIDPRSTYRLQPRHPLADDHLASLLHFARQKSIYALQKLDTFASLGFSTYQDAGKLQWVKNRETRSSGDCFAPSSQTCITRDFKKKMIFMPWHFS